MTTTLALPRLAYTGQTLALYPSVDNPLLNYRTLLEFGGVWDDGQGSALNGYRHVVLSQQGFHSLAVQGFNVFGGLVENLWVGQFQVLDPVRASELISRHDHRLAVREYDSDVSARASAQDWRAGITTFGEFITHVQTQQQAADPVAGLSAQASQALFYMQWVSGLWSYGNLDRPDLPGCVINNEATGPIDPALLTIRTYLDSPIGCCTDYTVLFSMLLEAAGIETRIVTKEGHNFNEALLDGEWWTLDANLNVAFRASWDKVLDLSQTIEVLRFEHEGMRGGSAIYRESLVDFYQNHMAQLEIGSASLPYRWDTSTYISYLPYAAALAGAMDVSNDGGYEQLVEQRDDNGFTTQELIALLVTSTARLAQSEIDSPVSAEAAQQAWRAGIASLAALDAYVETRFAASSGAPFVAPFSMDVGRLLFFAQWYGGLWTPGDVSGPDVQSVVDNDFWGSIAPADVDTRTFLDSPVGSAADAAALFASMLSRGGFANSIVTAGSYVINEFLADGQWWSVNAGLGVAFADRWHNAVNTATSPITYLFDMAAFTAGAPTFLSEASAAQRNFIVETGAGLLYDFDRYGAGQWLAEQPYGDIFSETFVRFHATVTASAWSSPQHGGYRWFFGDFDGDGKTDAFSYRPGVSGAAVQLSTGEGFSDISSWTTAGYGAVGWRVGDFNGDGRADIMRLVWGVSGADVFLSNGTGFTHAGSWTTAGPGNQHWYVGDFNGDGMDDLLRYVTGTSGAQVFLSQGTSFSLAGSWTSAGQGDGKGWFVGDFDGDGRADLGRILPGIGFQVLLSDGSTFKGPTTWTSDVGSRDGLVVMDIDGDGRDDLVVLGQASAVFLSTGAAFVQVAWDLPANVASNWARGDFNGDGTVDLFDFSAIGAPGMYVSHPVDTVRQIDAVSGSRESFEVSRAAGSTIISGFELAGPASDQLVVSPGIAADFLAFIGTGEQLGVDAVFDLGDGQTLTLKATLIDSLSHDHFLFA